MVSVLRFKRVINAFVKRRDNSIERLAFKKNIPMEYYKSLRELQAKIIEIKAKIKNVDGSSESEIYKKEIETIRKQIELIKEDIERLGSK